MKLYKYYYGICEHRLCAQVIESDKKQVGVIGEDRFLYLKSRDDDRAKQLFAEDEARKANESGSKEMAQKHSRRIQVILSEPVLEVRKNV